MRIFVDTSAWISLVAAKDPHHKEMAATWRRLLKDGVQPMTSSDVIGETITFLRFRMGHETAVDFRLSIGRSVGESRLLLAWVDEGLWEKAWEVFLKFGDQDLSMVDCTSCALCRQDRIKTALTLDRHFQAFGLEILPRPGA